MVSLSVGLRWGEEPPTLGEVAALVEHLRRIGVRDDARFEATWDDEDYSGAPTGWTMTTDRPRHSAPVSVALQPGLVRGLLTMLTAIAESDGDVRGDQADVAGLRDDLLNVLLDASLGPEPLDPPE